MTTQEIYDRISIVESLFKNQPGIFYIENSIDEYKSKPTSYHATLMDAVEALTKSSDWFCAKGTGIIHYREFGIDGKDIEVYSGGWDNKFGKLLI